jgi:hypothetical protein
LPATSISELQRRATTKQADRQAAELLDIPGPIKNQAKTKHTKMQLLHELT